jgi:hypothetical protein
LPAIALGSSLGRTHVRSLLKSVDENRYRSGETEAWLLHVNIKAPDRVSNSDGIVLGPAGIGIGNDDLARSFGADARFDSVNVDIRVSTGFQLKLRIPL